jgi:hypothetical protein
MPVWLPTMTEAAPEKELADEEAERKSLPSLRASGLAGAPSPLPLPGAAELLTLSSPFLLKKLFPWSHNPWHTSIAVALPTLIRGAARCPTRERP